MRVRHVYLLIVKFVFDSSRKWNDREKKPPIDSFKYHIALSISNCVVRSMCFVFECDRWLWPVYDERGEGNGRRACEHFIHHISQSKIECLLGLRLLQFVQVQNRFLAQNR